MNGLTLKYFGAAITDGQFGAWKPIGAEQQPTGGYQVAWQFGTTDQYTIWNVDASGNYVPAHVVVSGTSYALESPETALQQDLNDDGTIGLTAARIETEGSTDLAQFENAYYLLTGSSGPTVKYFGATVTSGFFAGWAPIGAEQVAGGYQVAWKLAGTDQYTIWNVDAAGNYLPSHVVVSGTSHELESPETAFQQDLNGDGTIGFP